MDQQLQNAFILGLERVVAWSDLLDDINVFPVADGDTGRNLLASLTPLRFLENDREETVYKLMMAARGNSGNIATRFFSGLLTADSFEGLAGAARLGRDKARLAVHDPRPGTMLTVFDSLVSFLEQEAFDNRDAYIRKMLAHLEETVRATPSYLPVLARAGVVDSGALGMFVFLESFFKSLINQVDDFIPITTRFKGLLEISADFQEGLENGYCVDTVVHLNQKRNGKLDFIHELGDQAVVIPHNDYLKVHLHTNDREGFRQRMRSLGEIVQWSDDDIDLQVESRKSPGKRRSLHIMTDAAGSLTRDDAREMGFTLLNSYIVTKKRSLPETLFSPEELYQMMRAGARVSTSQASDFERVQCYQRVLDQYDRVLYLSVGSVFTGNYDLADRWRQENDSDHRFTVIDTGAASGRLAVIVLATVRFAAETDDPEAIIAFARSAVKGCEEYVFLDKLQYLAAGGRLSRTSAFFGDTLHIKPIVSPQPEGAVKVGTARNQKDQIAFALKKLEATLQKESGALIMLEYSDNKTWVEAVMKKEISDRYPRAEILLQPFSLTSGVHMGPGTWALAFLPDRPA
ncbi:MAG: DegV family protein [bacterium]